MKIFRLTQDTKGFKLVFRLNGWHAAKSGGLVKKQVYAKIYVYFERFFEI